jgi:hypothetical protein
VSGHRNVQRSASRSGSYTKSQFLLYVGKDTPALVRKRTSLFSLTGRPILQNRVQQWYAIFRVSLTALRTNRWTDSRRRRVYRSVSTRRGWSSARPDKSATSGDQTCVASLLWGLVSKTGCPGAAVPVMLSRIYSGHSVHNLL